MRFFRPKKGHFPSFSPISIGLILVLFFSFLVIPLFAQPSSGIEYSANGSFHWGMFKGKINARHLDEMGTSTGAVTVSSLSYRTLDVTSKSATIKITAQFHPYESWTRYPKLNDPEGALIHEKRHFDICEIYARKLRQTMSQTDFSRGDFNEQLSSLFKKFSAEHKAAQAIYDDETDHSLDQDEQEKWNAGIDAQLKLLAEYSETVVTVPLN